jgi:hypothetical protein
MRFTLKICFALLAVALFFPGAAAAASFTASLDRDVIAPGESATLSLTFEGGSAKNVPTPKVPGLQIAQIGTSQSVNIINGAMNQTVTVTFSVTARQAGEFLIPALSADVNGQQLATEPLKLTVTKASAPSADAVNSGSEVAFLKFVFPKNKIYVGQSAVGQLQLYLRDDVQNFGNFQMSSLPTDGFSPGKTAELQNQRRRVQVGNRSYTVIPIAVPLTAVKSGSFVLGPFTGNVVVVLPSPNQGGNPFFNQSEQRPVTLVTEPFNVESLPLPEENKPANFSGAIGSFTMTATAGPTTLTVGDPITVRVQISGRGALDAVTLPTQDAWRDFKTYPATSKLEISDQLGFQGTKTFEQIISPQNSDVHELPPLTFSFFNPDDGQYHTLTHGAVALVVKAAGASPLPALAANKNNSPENQPPQDILPIKEKLGTLVPATVPLVTRPLFLVAQSVPVLAFFAAFVWRKRTDNLANNPRLRRQRAVAQLVNSGLSDLNKFAAENKSSEFFAMLFRLLQEQLGERLDCPASAITESDVNDRLIRIGASPATLESLHELFQFCNQARYAPIQTRQELVAVAGKFKKTVGELQKLTT